MGKGRKPCCDKGGVKKGAWSEDEDMKLISFIQTHGHSNWRSLPKLAGLARCGKSCRLRWVNYLSPDIKRGNFTVEEEDAIIKLHETVGNRWSKIASHFPGRTDNEIKNVWNTHLKKRIKTKDQSSATISSEETLDEVLINGNNNIINECKQKILMHQTIISSIDMTPNEQQLQLQQLNSPSTSCCSQASFSGLNVNDFNPTKGFVTKDAPDMVEDVCDMDEIGINVNEIETDLVDELLNTPFEPNFEWCDLLDGDYNSATQSQVKLNDNSNNQNNNSEESDGSWWWLVYLENELGLLSQS